MRIFGLSFIIIGIFLVSLSGFEKILIYSSLSDRTHDFLMLKMITPDEIWNITHMTMIFGILILIIGLVMSLWDFVIAEMKKIREANKQFALEQGMNQSNKDEVNNS